MKTKMTLLLFVFLVSVISLSAGDRQTRYDRFQPQMDAVPNVMTAPYNYNPESIVFTFPLDQGFTTDSLTLGAEILTGITGFYDYKSNGEANIFIQVDPSNPQNVHVTDYQTDSTDPTGANLRRTRYAASTNGGANWEVLDFEVPDVRSGFPVLILKNGQAIIANHSTNNGGILDANLYVDIAPVTGVFEEKAYSTHAPFGIWPQIALQGDGSVGMVSRRNVSSTAPPETLYYAKWDGSSTLIGARTPVYISGMTFVGTVGSNMRFHLGSSGNNVTAIIAPVNQDDTLGNSKVFARTSTNNGTTWGDVTTIFAPFTENAGQDTIASSGGSGFTYKPGTSNWYYAYVTSADGLFASAKLKMRKSDGSTVVLTDAATVGATSSFNKAMAFVFSIDFPALGWSADGSTMYCVYSVVMPDTGASGFNQRDIFAQYSLNNGTTWSSPIRITNTPTIDEAYPSVSAWNKGSAGNPYEVNIVYMKDPGVGPTSFNGNSPTAPPSRNNLVYRKLTGLPPIGILGNQTILKDYKLAQNYPNPFNPTTKIEYNIVKTGFVSLKVYDILGREVATLVNGVQTQGVKEIEFNGSNLTSGVYFYTIKAGDFTDTKTMVLVK